MTAHGITDALHDAELVARAAGAGTSRAFEDYRNLRDALSLPLLRITDEIATCDWTMDRLAALHDTLNQAMKTETAVMSGLVLPVGAPEREAA